MASSSGSSSTISTNNEDPLPTPTLYPVPDTPVYKHYAPSPPPGPPPTDHEVAIVIDNGAFSPPPLPSIPIQSKANITSATQAPGNSAPASVQTPPPDSPARHKSLAIATEKLSRHTPSAETIRLQMQHQGPRQKACLMEMWWGILMFLRICWIIRF